MNLIDASAPSGAKAYLAKLQALLAAIDASEIDAAIETIRSAWAGGRQIITLGNGGSAMTALHMITDWNKGISVATKVPFRGRSLIDNMGLVTAYSNDVSYADVFVEQLKYVAEPGDLIIAISGSGNSENVLRAVAHANKIGCHTLALVGYSGGKLKGIAKQCVWINVNDMQLCEDLHAIFGHIVMQKLCGML